MKENEQSLGEMWNPMKCINICKTGVPKGEERKKGEENIFKEIMAGDFPGGPMVKTLPSNAGIVGSIPGQGAKIPHVSWPKKPKHK